MWVRSHNALGVFQADARCESQRSIATLKPFGRFIELGKRDYVANTRIGLRPFKRNLSYFGVDVDQQDLSPEHVLASALSDYSVVIRQVTDMYLNRERMRPPADTGLHSRATGLALNERLVPYNVTRSINRIKELVEAGRTLETAHGRSIRVPDNEASYQEFLKQL